MKITKTKTQLYQILTGVFVACLLISNILASKTFTLSNFILPTAVIVFPVVYIVNDIMAEVYGFKKTRNVIYLGFVLNAFAVLVYSIAIKLPSPVFATENAEAFEIVFGNTLRLLVASFSAYLIGSLINASAMEKMKKRLEKHLMLRCVVSTLLGEGLDAIVFITIAFAGSMPVNELLIMIIAQATFKTLFEIVCYPITRVLINKVKSLKE